MNTSFASTWSACAAEWSLAILQEILTEILVKYLTTISTLHTFVWSMHIIPHFYRKVNWHSMLSSANLQIIYNICLICPQYFPFIKY